MERHPGTLGTIDDQDQASLCARVSRPAWQVTALRAPARIAPRRPSGASWLAGVHAGISGRPERLRAPLRAPKAGTLAALAAEFFGSAEFANLKSSSQRVYRVTLGPVLELDGHRLV